MALVLAATAAAMSPAQVAVADSGTLTRISVSSSGVQANGASTTPVLTPDARFAVFASSASNLVSGDTNGVSDIFLYERATGSVSRVSVGSAGEQANGASFDPTISADGRLIAFRSNATNLGMDVPPNISQVYLRDVIAGTTVVASTDANGVPGDSFSSTPRISADGTVIAFTSLARNLVPNDRNGTTDVFVHSLVTGATSIVSVGPTGTQVGSPAIRPAISADGRLVAFESNSLLTSDAGAFTGHLYLRDTVALTIVLIANGAGMSAMTPDGRFLAFNGSVVVGNTSYGVVLVRDLSAGSTVVASLSNTGALPTGPLVATLLPAISADGTHVAFWSNAVNLVDNDTNGGGDWFVRDLGAGTTTRVSLTASGAQDGPTSITPSTPPGSLSGDGGFVVFESPAAGLVPADTNGVVDIFLRRVQAPNSVPIVTLGADEAVYVGSEFVRVAHFVDPDEGQTWSATVDYGDGPSGPLVLSPDKTFTLRHTYARLGMYTVRVTVTDSVGGSGQATFLLNAVHLPLIFVPGLAGSELVSTGHGTLAVEQPDGSFRNQNYSEGDVLWATLPALVADEGSFNILRFADGKPILETIAPDGSVFALQLPGGAKFGYTDVAPFFEDNGYVSGVNYFTYAYDWRFAVETRAQGLDDLIGEVLSRTGAPGVDVVAHSQGTLVTRAFLLTGSHANAASHVVLAGSPQLGTPKGSYALLAGTCLNEPGKTPFGLCVISPRELQFIARTLPGLVEDAVTADYFGLYDGTDPLFPVPYQIRPIQGDDPVPATYERLRDAELAESVDITALDFAELFHSDDRSWLGDAATRTNARVALVAGTGQCTLGQISESIKPALGPTGRPAGFKTVYDYVEVDGDGTVTRGSAALGRTKSAEFAGSPGSVSTYFRYSQHGQLVSNDFLPDILRILRDEPVAQGDIATPDCPLFSTHSPVEFVLTDQEGRRVGSFDGKTGFQEVPGSSYDRFADMKVAALAPGEYRAELHGTADGEALIQIRFVHGQVTQEFRFPHVPVGVHTVATMSFDTTTATIGDLTVDEDGDGRPDFTRAAIILGAASAVDETAPSVSIDTPRSGQAVVGTVPISWTASDEGSGVERSYAWLDRGVGDAFGLTAPGTLAFTPGDHRIEVFAEDRAGNVATVSRAVTAFAFGWRSPLDGGAMRANARQTIPVKFDVTDPSGAAVEDRSVRLSMTTVSGTIVAGSLSFTRNPASGIVFDGGAYHADLSTRGVPPGDYVLHVTFDSAGLVGSVSVPVSLR